eukprot:jgi/Chlat1/1010/Chrsp109S01440
MAAAMAAAATAAGSAVSSPSVASVFRVPAPSRRRRAAVTVTASASSVSLPPTTEAAETARPATADSASSASPAASSPAASSPSRGPIKLTRRAATTALFASALAPLVGCPCCVTGGGVAKADEWGYVGEKFNWGGMCAAGNTQSPINIELGKTAAMATAPYNININYRPSPASVLNTGHGTMQVQFPPGVSGIRLDGRELELLQYHFHAYSEHTINGVHSPMESHLVHRDVATGQLVVLGTLMESHSEAVKNSAICYGLKFSPTTAKEERKLPLECEPRGCYAPRINPMDLLPRPNADGVRPYITYAGSLTTPPCSEEVLWIVFTDPLRVPGEQVVDFMKYVGEGRTFAFNSRPVQPPNGRKMQYGMI